MKTVVIQIVLYLLFALSQVCWQVDNNASSSNTFQLKGRVVNENNQPVDGSVLILIPVKTEDEKKSRHSWEEIFDHHVTDKDGRFRLEIKASRHSRWRLYVLSPLATDTALPLLPPFAETLTRRYPALAGQEIDVTGKTDIALGDVPVQIEYGQVVVNLSPQKIANISSTLNLRLYDATGDWTGRGGGVEANVFRKGETAIAISLPEGHWGIHLTTDESKGWSETFVSVSRSSLQIPEEIYVDISREMPKQPAIDYSHHEAAKKELMVKGFAFTEDSFVERAALCNVRAVRLFLQAGMPQNAKGRYGNTALMEAISNRCQELTILLLSQQADINIKNNDGVTALHLAVMAGQMQVVDALLKAGANINEPMNDGITALMFAASSNRKRVVNRLILAGADVNLKDGNGRTALDWAVERENSEIIGLLKKAGARQRARR